MSSTALTWSSITCATESRTSCDPAPVYEVDTVIVDGKVLMDHGKLTTIDEEQVYEEVRKIAERLTAQ